MKRRLDHRKLIDRGRKAGLTTSELYQAMAVRPVEAADSPGRTDGNGFVVSYDQNGHPIYLPKGSAPPS